jgi:hypothetical protein
VHHLNLDAVISQNKHLHRLLFAPYDWEDDRRYRLRQDYSFQRGVSVSRIRSSQCILFRCCPSSVSCGKRHTSRVASPTFGGVGARRSDAHIKLTTAELKSESGAWGRRLGRRDMHFYTDAFGK